MTAYKQTELGLIPSDWEIRKIDDIVKIQTGNRNTQDKIKDGKYPFFVRSQQVERINSYSFDGEGVLTAGDGVGTGKIFHYINGKFDYHQRVYLMHDFSKNNIDGFYFYLFFSNNFYNRIMAMTAKSSVDSVRRDMIAEMYIILPPKPEQTAIATALSNTDALLAELEKLLAKKHAIKTATMQQLLTGKTRLPEFAHRADGTPKGSLKTEWGDIPEDWEVVALGDVGNTYAGLTGKNKDDFGIGNCFYVPFTNVMANIEVNINQLDKVNVNEKQNSVLKNDLLFNGSSETPEEICFSSLVNFDIPNL